MKLRFVLVAYGAAGVSFLMSLLRDYVVINFSAQSQSFFQLLYVVSMAAGFGVNAIALGSGRLGRQGLAMLALLGAILIGALLPVETRSPFVFVVLMAILLMWIAGAHWSRGLIERGWIFCGRIREAVASFVLALLVLAGLGVEVSFLLGVAAGCIFAGLMWRHVHTAHASATHEGAGKSKTSLKRLMQNILLTNVATSAITYWALVQTGQAGTVFGIEVSTAVRFSMYIYQVLTIGSIVLVSSTARLMRDRHVVVLAFAAGGLFLVALILPLQAKLLLLPLCAATLHYGVVLHLQQLDLVRH
ncbi:MAG: hypothetical protein ABJA49_02905 [Betaproteobacteria bacterium]